MTHLPFFPFEPELAIGTIVEITPLAAKVNLPLAGKAEGATFYGNRYGRGEVGEFVFIEASKYAILGRVTLVKLPERERLTVEPTLGRQVESHPIGTVQLLSTLVLSDGEVLGGISEFPRIGASVFSAHPELIKWIAEYAKRDKGPSPLKLNFAHISEKDQTQIAITPEKLFGRHCAVLGSTGGGKSWTLAKILETLEDTHAKAVLIDATGEYHTLEGAVTHVHFDAHPQLPATSTEVVVPYNCITEHELFVMFRPSLQSQGPKLRNAMKSLKLAKLDPTLTENGFIKKENQPKAPFEAAYKKHIAKIDNEMADFEISKLTSQIDQECCYLNAASWGKIDQKEQGYCVSLLNRIESMIGASELACIFKPENRASVFDAIGQFLGDPTKRVFRISMSHLPFAYDTREIVANAIGKHLLKVARKGGFKTRPLVVLLDEAHNFMSKSIGDELSKYSLDAFESIAREGRKFCLTICLATQRPRDLPDSVLSQMGTMIVHRLTGNNDREAVERASGDVDRSAASFLPTLGPGEAILVGTDFPFPLTIKIIPPKLKPDSKGPDYQSLW